MLGSLSVQALPFTPLNRPLRRFAGGGGPVDGVSSQVEQGGASEDAPWFGTRPAAIGHHHARTIAHSLPPRG